MNGGVYLLGHLETTPLILSKHELKYKNIMNRIIILILTKNETYIKVNWNQKYDYKNFYKMVRLSKKNQSLHELFEF